MILYLASTNPGKLKEFREAAQSRGIRVEPVPGIAQLPPCIEDGRTFEENARKKALYYSHQTAGMVFTDDSGICVDALDGAPGIYSARFAGPQASDEENNQKLLSDLRAIEPNASKPASEVAPPPRSAHYVCMIALAQRDRILMVTEGRADGVILHAPRGTGGFGYDPLFFFPPLGKTYAELTPQEKFRVSHRGEAFRKLLEYLTVSRR